MYNTFHKLIKQFFFLQTTKGYITKVFVKIHFDNFTAKEEVVQWEGGNYFDLCSSIMKKHKGSTDVTIIKAIGKGGRVARWSIGGMRINMTPLPLRNM